jgi:hypothetical protein
MTSSKIKWMTHTRIKMICKGLMKIIRKGRIIVKGYEMKRKREMEMEKSVDRKHRKII